MPKTRIPWEQYLQETSDEERNLLRFEINCAIRHFLDSDRPVCLEGLGIVVPEISEEVRSYNHNDKLVLRNETLRSLRFEKCDDTAALPAEIIAKLVQTRELTARIFPRLPVTQQVKWTENLLKIYVRTFFRHIRSRVIRTGRCSVLSTVGDFYALHNRQGQTSSEWYAGADIFLKPRPAVPALVGSVRTFERPVLDSAWEIFKAAFGRPVQTWEIKIADALREMGYGFDPAQAPGFLNVIRIAAFSFNPASGEQQAGASPAKRECGRVIFCTDGLRESGLASGRPAASGTELTVQLTRDHISPALIEIPAIVRQQIVLGWILLVSSKSKALKPGVGIASRGPLGLEGSRLFSVFTTALKMAPLEHLSKEGPFHFINLIGITQDEAALVEKHSRNHLLAVLEARGMDQVTRPERSSAFSRTFLDPAIAEAPAMAIA